MLAEHTNSTLRGSWMLLMLTVPLQGWRGALWESGSPDPLSLSLLTSASKAARFSPAFRGKSKIRPCILNEPSELCRGFQQRCVLLEFNLQETRRSFSASASCREPFPCSSSLQQLRACSVCVMIVCNLAASSFKVLIHKIQHHLINLHPKVRINL